MGLTINKESSGKARMMVAAWAATSGLWERFIHLPKWTTAHRSLMKGPRCCPPPVPDMHSRSLLLAVSFGITALRAADNGPPGGLIYAPFVPAMP